MPRVVPSQSRRTREVKTRERGVIGTEHRDGDVAAANSRSGRLPQVLQRRADAAVEIAGDEELEVGSLCLDDGLSLQGMP